MAEDSHQQHTHTHYKTESHIYLSVALQGDEGEGGRASEPPGRL